MPMRIRVIIGDRLWRRLLRRGSAGEGSHMRAGRLVAAVAGVVLAAFAATMSQAGPLDRLTLVGASFQVSDSDGSGSNARTGGVIFDEAGAFTFTPGRRSNTFGGYFTASAFTAAALLEGTRSEHAKIGWLLSFRVEYESDLYFHSQFEIHQNSATNADNDDLWWSSIYAQGTGLSSIAIEFASLSSPFISDYCSIYRTSGDTSCSRSTFDDDSISFFLGNFGTGSIVNISGEVETSAFAALFGCSLLGTCPTGIATADATALLQWELRAVPEPSTLILLAPALLGIITITWRRRGLA